MKQNESVHFFRAVETDKDKNVVILKYYKFMSWNYIAVNSKKRASFK